MKEKKNLYKTVFAYLTCWDLLSFTHSHVGPNMYDLPFFLCWTFLTFIVRAKTVETNP